MGDEADYLMQQGIDMMLDGELDGYWSEDGYGGSPCWYPRFECVDFEDVLCLAETPKAILVVINENEHWVPRSCLGSRNEVEKVGDQKRLVITKWLAKRKGLQ